MKMRKTPRFPKWLFLVLLGMTCAAATGTAVWYDLTYNSGRLVYPMDSYAFQIGRASCRERVWLKV